MIDENIANAKTADIKDINQTNTDINLDIKNEIVIDNTQVKQNFDPSKEKFKSKKLDLETKLDFGLMRPEDNSIPRNK